MFYLGQGISRLNLSHDDRDDPLAIFNGTINLIQANFGFDRIWADKENEVIRFFNALLNAFFAALFNALFNTLLTPFFKSFFPLYFFLWFQ